MQMEKQMFGKQTFAWLCWSQWDTERNVKKQTLLCFSLSTHLDHTLVTYGDGFLFGPGPVCSFKQLVGSSIYILLSS